MLDAVVAAQDLGRWAVLTPEPAFGGQRSDVRGVVLRFSTPFSGLGEKEIFLSESGGGSIFIFAFDEIDTVVLIID